MHNVLWFPALVFLLGTLVFFHELGHFMIAKLFRIRVDEFAFGFGPKWIRLFKRGETEYTIHPIPLGGFVKLAGQEPGEQDVPGGFNSKPWYQRYLVYLAGPFMSFLLAYLIFCGLGFVYGLPKVTNRVEKVETGSPAAQAGLLAGDRIIEIGGNRITSGEQMIEIIHGSLNKQLAITIDRSGRIIRIQATPRAGKLGERVGLLGFAPTTELVRAGIMDSAKAGTVETYKFVALTLQSIFSRHVGENIGGPLAIADATRQSIRGGVESYIFLMAILSLGLGIVNLLPIPVVDGGQMVLLVIEGIRGRRLSQRTLEIVSAIGLMTIVVLFVLIMFLDISKIASGKLWQKTPDVSMPAETPSEGSRAK